MKKIISILVCVCVLLSAMVFSASAANGVTYTFSSYKEGAAVSNYSKALDDTITVGLYGDTDFGSGYFNNELRIYQGAYATITSTKEISSIVLNAGHKDGTYDVSTSTDGSQWTVVVDDATYTSAYSDLEIAFATPVKYVKIEATKQMRVKTMTVAFSGETGGEVTPPVEDEEPITTITLVDSPVAGTAYKYGMIQGNVSETDVYYIDGAMSSYYMNTTTDVTAAIDVYLEEVEGGYSLYAMVDGAKKYINMVVSGTYVNGKYEDAASTVYTFNAEKKALVAIVNDTEYWIGTRNDKTYTTVGPVKTSYNGFYCQLYVVTVEEKEPEVPENNDPAADSELTIAEAIALGASKEHNTYTESKYYITGEITEVYGPQYGNMRVTDADGNILTIYGSWSADGETRYDALEEKPIAGDTVKLYGIIGQYNETPQMKNAWIVEIVKGEGEAPVAPEKAEDILADADKLEPGSTLPYEATLTGKVVSIDTEYSEQYGNVTVTIEVDDTNGKTIQCFRLKGEGAATLAVGDKITVTGFITNYNGKVQFNTGATFVPATDDNGGSTDNGGTTTGGTTTPETKPNTDSSTTSPTTGDNVGAIVAMAVAAAAVLVASKKR